MKYDRRGSENPLLYYFFDALRKDPGAWSLNYGMKLLYTRAACADWSLQIGREKHDKFAMEARKVDLKDEVRTLYLFRWCTSMISKDEVRDVKNITPPNWRKIPDSWGQRQTTASHGPNTDSKRKLIERPSRDKRSLFFFLNV